MPKVFLLTFDDQYDLGMTFLRYQEYYENPNKKFKNKRFFIVDFMEYYSKKYGNGLFTYPKDFVGFNIPGNVLIECARRIPFDQNKYDDLMVKLTVPMFQSYKENFYLIGSTNDNKKVIEHELAHAMWHLYEDYKKEMKENISVIPTSTLKTMKKWFKQNMYCSQVYNDEIQAYFSTGLTSDQKRLIVNEHTKPILKMFQNTFQKHYKKNTYE